jgi:hypothetical protein
LIILDPSKRERERRKDGFMDLRKIFLIVTRHQSNKGNYSHNQVDWVTKTKNQIFFKMSTLPHILVDFSKSLFYVTKCMHPLQMNSL